MNSRATVSDQTTYSELQFWYWLLKVLHWVEKVHSIREVIWLTSIPLTNHLVYSYERKKKEDICLTRKVITKFWFSTSCLGHVNYSSADSSTYFKMYAHHSRWHFIFSELCTTSTWSLERPDALCPVSCSVGTWVVLCLASGTIFFTVISCKGWCYDQTVHIGEI